MNDQPRPLDDEPPISGWKELAAFVKISASAARRLAWRRRDPLPVWRYLHTVCAWPSALREWRKRQMIPIQLSVHIEELEKQAADKEFGSAPDEEEPEKS